MEEEEEEDDEATAAGSGSGQLAEVEGGEVSGPTAPCSTSPAAACSASRVGEDGGEGRDFFLLDDNSFRRLFFSLCKKPQQQLDGRNEQILKPFTCLYILEETHFIDKNKHC